MSIKTEEHKNIELSNQIVSESYNEMPYESYPYAQSNPHHLRTIATLFGLKSAEVENARILELGCAGGGNILPLAVNYPKAHFVGVDLSKVQIEEANAHKTALNLNNIDFHELSIADIDENFGKFDYIICHGVFSWVPKHIQAKIFEISKKNLSSNGIAYISYNTLPGWNMVRSVREMMLYHSSMFTSVNDKIAQSRLLLDFIKDSLDGSSSPYALMLRNEAALVAKQSDHYIRHEYLEENNTQLYFKDFMVEANKHGLQYLADASLSTMFVGNMPVKAAEALQTINDIVRTEQYMDFINNRRFRSTLLCHADAKINRTINNEDIAKFNLSMNVQAEKPLSEIDLNNSLETIKFFYNNNQEINLSTSSPVMKAILYSFVERNNNLESFDKIVANAHKKLGNNHKIEEVKNELLNNAMRLVFQGYINITMREPRKVSKTDKPKISKLAQYQNSQNNKMWVTNHRHEAVGLNFFDKIAMRYMDGKNDIDKISQHIDKHIESKEITISRDNKPIEDPKETGIEIKNALKATIDKLNSFDLLD